MQLPNFFFLFPPLFVRGISLTPCLSFNKTRGFRVGRKTTTKTMGSFVSAKTKTCESKTGCYALCPVYITPPRSLHAKNNTHLFISILWFFKEKFLRLHFSRIWCFGQLTFLGLILKITGYVLFSFLSFIFGSQLFWQCKKHIPDWVRICVL